MRIRKRAGSILNLNEEDRAYLHSIHSPKYRKINFIIQVVIVLLTILLPILYLNVVRPEWFINSAVFESAKTAYFILYKVTWMSHVIAMFIFIPCCITTIFYFCIKYFKNYKTFAILNSFLFYACNIRKTLSAISDISLNEKLDILHLKFIKTFTCLSLFSVLFGAMLLFFDLNNYFIITEDLIKYRNYGSFSSRVLTWNDLKAVYTGCNYRLTSYQNAFVRMKWHYKLIFNNNLILDLHNFESKKGENISDILMVNSIVKAFNIPKNTDDKSGGFLMPDISNEMCKNYLKSNYSSDEYDALLKILDLK